MENEELLPLKRRLAEKAASKQLDSYGYYLYASSLMRGEGGRGCALL